MQKIINKPFNTSQVSSRSINRLIDTMNNLEQESKSLLRTCSVSTVVNVGSTIIMPFGIACVNDSAASDYQTTEPVIEVELPTIDSNLSHMVIAIDNIKPGEAGKAIIAGVYWCLVNPATTGMFGSPLPTSQALALSDTPGPCQILAKSGGGNEFCLVRFPMPSNGDHYQFLVSNAYPQSYLPGIGY